MRTLSPKIAFRNNLIHDIPGLIQYRNKMALYETFKSGDLKIWVANHLSVEVPIVNGDNSIEAYYQFISMLDHSVSYSSEAAAFQQLLNTLCTGVDQYFEAVLESIEKIILGYEIFFARLSDIEISSLKNSHLNVFIGFSIIIDQYSKDISEQFINMIKGFLKAGYQGDDKRGDFTVNRADDFTKITELKTKFIITDCKGPLTLENLSPSYDSAKRATSFVDIYNHRSSQQVINKIYAPGAKIDLKDSSAYAEYIEVKYDE